MSKLSELEQGMTVQILVLLLKRSMKMTEIIDQVPGSSGTVYRAIPRLRQLGLINDNVTPYPVKRIFSLTERGRRVAEKLQEIEGILVDEGSEN